jgi:hypothetical protein
MVDKPTERALELGSAKEVTFLAILLPDCNLTHTPGRDSFDG